MLAVSMIITVAVAVAMVTIYGNMDEVAKTNELYKRY